jgi:hypothetical protein
MKDKGRGHERVEARGRQGTHPSVSTASMSDTIMMACQFSAMFFSDVAASTGFSYRDALPHNGMAPVRACVRQHTSAHVAGTCRQTDTTGVSELMAVLGRRYGGVRPFRVTLMLPYDETFSDQTRISPL